MQRMSLDMSDFEQKEILEKQTKLLEENNRLLHQIHRYDVLGFWFRILWYTILIGFPFALYFYVLEPYFSALGSSYETFYVGMQEIPGVKQFNEALNLYRSK